MPEFMLSMPLTFCAFEHICAQCSCALDIQGGPKKVSHYQIIQKLY